MSYLGIDCGTQSLKVLAWCPERGALASASRVYDLIEGLPPGHKEQHPDIWLTALDDCMQELGGRTHLGEVRGIGVSGQQHGLVVLDGADQVVRPAKLWNDTSTQEECDSIVEACGGIDAYRAEIGNALPPGFTASKVVWIRRHEPENYRKIRSFFLPHDYLNFHLTGNKAAEYGDASGTGYFRVRERTWSEKVLQAMDPEGALREFVPPLIGPCDEVGKVRQSLARRWGLNPSARVSSGGGDNMMGAVGSGNVAEGRMTVSLGTSGTLFSFSRTPVLDPGGDIAGFCDSTGGWLPLGCTMNVTVATEMIRKAFLATDHAGLEASVQSVPPGSDGLILIPYLEGERMPSVSAGTGVYLGIRPATASPAHFARAAMEGVTMGLKYGFERMKSLGLHPTELRLIGGGAKSAVWRQMVADFFNLPVACPASEEGPALGAAVQAFWMVNGGAIADLADRCVRLSPETRRQPAADRVARYEDLYQLYSVSCRTLIGSPVFELHRRWIG